MKKSILAIVALLGITFPASAVPVNVGYSESGTLLYVDPDTFYSEALGDATLSAIFAQEFKNNVLIDEYWFVTNCNTGDYRLVDKLANNVTEAGKVQVNTVGEIYFDYVCK